MWSIDGGGIAVGVAGGRGAVHHSGEECGGGMRHVTGGGTVGFVLRHEMQTGLYF